MIIFIYVTWRRFDVVWPFGSRFSSFTFGSCLYEYDDIPFSDVFFAGCLIKYAHENEVMVMRKSVGS